MHSSSSRARRGRPLRPAAEAIEPRAMLSGLSPTAVEQYYLELLDDARFNPGAYGASMGLDLSAVSPSQPLAMNPMLVESARGHSADMIARGYFAHYTPEGAGPGDRIAAAGFDANGWAESIETNTQPSMFGGAFAGDFATWDAGFSLSDLIVDNGVPDLGHRIMLLDIGGQDRAMRQVGIGIASQDSTSGGFAYRQTDTTIDLAATTDTGPYLTGVVFNDLAGIGEYQPGEGLAGVTITVAGAGSTTTMDAGGYAIPLAPGTYTVTASGGGLAAPIARTVVVGEDNVRLDFDADPNGAVLNADPSGIASGPLGSFDAMAAGDTAASYSARIDWGDGHATFATLTANPDGTFGVQGANVYASPGVYAARVLVTRLADGKTVAIDATVVVGGTATPSPAPAPVPAPGAPAGGAGTVPISQLSTDPGNTAPAPTTAATIASPGPHHRKHAKAHHPAGHHGRVVGKHAAGRRSKPGVSKALLIELR